MAASLDSIRADSAPAGEPAISPLEAFQNFLNQLKKDDKCGAIFTGKVHGYDVKDYLVRTNDKYELHLHRLVHPEDFLAQAAGARPRKKKPYLLVHGLIGTSASFLTSIDENYRAPPASYDVSAELHGIFEKHSRDYQYAWTSTAETMRRNSIYEEWNKFIDWKRKFADLLGLQFDADHMDFGRKFSQAYKKFPLPKAAIGYTTHSLAMTLSNFGYDVWMINLRGNRYSRGFNGPRRQTDSPEYYWDFGIEKIIQEDMAATIRFIERETALREGENLGVVTFSYSAIHVMGLVTKFPKYLKQLRPIIMLAPTMLTGTQDRGKLKYLIKGLTKIISHNGPFPERDLEEEGSKSGLLNLKLQERLHKLLCSMPITSKLCRLFEMIVLGAPKQVSSVRGLLTSDRKSLLLQRDIDCGRTSKQILREVLNHITEDAIDLRYMPFVHGRQSTARPSFMIFHSDSDSISTPSEVQKIRDTSLQTLTLADYLIREPNFEHTDFLFSSRNQYLVNAEVVRMALVHDHLTYMFDAPPPQMKPAPYDARHQPAPAYRSSSGSAAAAAAASGPGAAAASAAGPSSSAAAAAATGLSG